MTLAADEFMRRFLLHVLPDGFQRIRHFGFLANCSKKHNLARCRQFLGVEAPAPAPAGKSNRERWIQITGVDPACCPVCHVGTLVVIGPLSAPPDSS
jgi:hypothetical protein